MSVLTLVRHGQASFLAANYDRLSALGERQSQQLGLHWARLNLSIDQVYCGPRQRQRKSAEIAADQYGQAGMDWPELQELPELDEYDLTGLMQHLVPRLTTEDANFARLVNEYQQCQEEPLRTRNFQKMFEVCLQHWQDGKAAHQDLESWPAFERRVAKAIDHIRRQAARSSRIVLFTSGGFISVAVQQALGVSNRCALELSWRIRNSSLTELIFTDDRITLDQFNAVPHLPEPGLWTYR